MQYTVPVIRSFQKATSESAPHRVRACVAGPKTKAKAMFERKLDWRCEQLPPTALLLVGTCDYLFALFQSATTWKLRSLLTISFAMAVVCSKRCASEEAGEVPESWNVIQPAGTAVDLSSLPTREVKGNGRRRVCLKSTPTVYKPDRAHYCRQLGRVVLKFDHFSLWHNNAIGFYNHKFFFLFTFYGSLTASLSALMAWLSLTKSSTTSDLVVVGILTAIALGMLCVFGLHAFLVCRNQTFKELLKKSSSDAVAQPEDGLNPYDCGLVANLKEEFGSNFGVEWFLPVRTSHKGDGLSFDRWEDRPERSTLVPL